MNPVVAERQAFQNCLPKDGRLALQKYFERCVTSEPLHGHRGPRKRVWGL